MKEEFDSLTIVIYEKNLEMFWLFFKTFFIHPQKVILLFVSGLIYVR